MIIIAKKSITNIETSWYKTSKLAKQPSKDLRKGKSYYFGFIKIKGRKDKLFHIYANNKAELKKKLNKQFKR